MSSPRKTKNNLTTRPSTRMAANQAHERIIAEAERRGHGNRTGGAGLGALFGAMIGSFAGVPGAFIGGAIGGSLGAAVGNAIDAEDR